jgi:hypothetical protein
MASRMARLPAAGVASTFHPTTPRPLLPRGRQRTVVSR